ncbi:MAG: hypothetical protein AB7W16_10300 [Candidatus Obscuribacterales bacterium]
MATKAAKERITTLTKIALVILGVGTISGMYLSLSHLAETIHSFTVGGGETDYKSWFMALVIDGFLLGAELSIIIQTYHKDARGFSITLFLVCAFLSVALNTWAFVEHAPADKPWAKEFAIMLGVLLPAMIIVAAVVASKLLQGLLGSIAAEGTSGSKQRTNSPRKRTPVKKAA